MSTDDAQIPDDLATAVAADPPALASYGGLPPSHRREHLEWIGEARRPGTRRRRIEKTIGMLHA